MAIKTKTHSGTKARFRVKGKKRAWKKNQPGRGLTIEKAESMHNHLLQNKSTRTRKRRQDNSKLHPVDFKKVLKLLVR